MTNFTGCMRYGDSHEMLTRTLEKSALEHSGAFPPITGFLALTSGRWSATLTLVAPPPPQRRRYDQNNLYDFCRVTVYVFAH